MLLFQTAITRADDHGSRGDKNERGNRDHGHHRDAKVTFTKWITLPFPPPSGIFANLEGIVGGDVGDGTMTGEAFTAVLQPDGVTTLVDAEYHFHGSKHSFTFRFQAVQTRFNNGGVITGVVTEGWLKGNVVEGGYTRYACAQGANGFCFDGILEIKRGSKHGHDDDDDDDDDCE